jgi:hypothetical protein
MKRSLEYNISRIQNIMGQRLITESKQEPVIVEQATIEKVLAKVAGRNLVSQLSPDIIQRLEAIGLRGINTLEDLRTALAGRALSVSELEVMMKVSNNIIKRNIFNTIIDQLPQNIYKSYQAGDINKVIEFLDGRHFQPEFLREFERVDNALKSSAAKKTAIAGGKAVQPTVVKTTSQNVMQKIAGYKWQNSMMVKALTYALHNPRKCFAMGAISVPLVYNLLDSLYQGVMSEEEFTVAFGETWNDNLSTWLATMLGLPEKVRQKIQERKARKAAMSGHTAPTTPPAPEPAPAAPTNVIAEIEGKYPCVKGTIVQDIRKLLWVKATDGQHYQVNYNNGQLTWANGTPLTCQ